MQCIAGRDKLCDVQVWPPEPEGMADDVRLGQDVPALPEPLETGDAQQQGSSIWKQ